MSKLINIKDSVAEKLKKEFPGLSYSQAIEELIKVFGGLPPTRKISDRQMDELKEFIEVKVRGMEKNLQSQIAYYKANG